MINYKHYKYTKGELVRYGLAGGSAGFAILMLFYDNFFFCGLCSIFCGILFLQYYRHTLAEKRRWELMIQFKDAMESLVSALVAGYSLENAVRQAGQDLELMYERDDIIILEMSYMIRKMDLKVSVEALLKDLGVRSGVEDIVVFSEVLITAKRTGENIIQVMRRTAANMAEKMEMKREIETMLAGKRMESKCMTAIPLFMILYLRICSPGFLDPLYHNGMGVIVMTAALAVYSFSFWWGQRIMNIQF